MLGSSSFVTGGADDVLRARALQQGAVALLSKPFSEVKTLGFDMLRSGNPQQ